jgi:nucleoside-diphosphate-sugar epimerase
MKFVVTGGAGFIGSYIVKYLVENGFQVIVVDNLFRGKLSNLAGCEEKIDFHNLDILNFEELRKLVKDSDGIFHQAALTSVPESFTQKDKYQNVNVNGTENIFKLGKEFGIKIVYASSSSVYGNPKSIPIKENASKNPINPYGKTKLDTEILAEQYSKLGVKIIGLRYFNVYGIGQTNDYAGVITKFYEALKADNPPIIFGDGTQVRDFISVKDTAKANLLSMKSSTDYALLNIGTGIATSINDLANLMIKLSGKPLVPIYSNLPEGDVKESQADINLTKQLINWMFETNLEDGLKKFFFS